MQTTVLKRLAISMANAVLLLVAFQAAASAPPVLPNPVLAFSGQSFYQVSGTSFTRYTYFVDNRNAYPGEMFAAAPALPPCGLNTRSSRTWVDVYDQNGKRLNGFCALSSPDGLVGIWFALGVDVIPPSWVYIEMTDRQTNIKYKSNLAETTQ